MEALLNLLWFVIACTAISVWRGIWRRRVAPSMREWLALATLLFLLFPVISLTDDLHEELAVAECATGTKHFLTSVHGMAPQDHGVRTTGVFTAILPSRFSVTFAPHVDRLAQASSRAEIPSAVSICSGRSPPLVSL
jgi:hypothetical protein